MEPISPISNPPLSLPRLPGAWTILKSAIVAYKEQWKIFVGILVIPVVLWILVYIAATGSLGVAAILGVVVVIVSFFAQLATFSVITGISKDVTGTSTVGRAYRVGLSKFWPFVWISFLSSFAALGGAFLLVVPGIVISIFLSLSVFVLFSEDRRGLGALTSSWHYVRGYGWALFGRILFVVLVMIVIAIIFGILGGESFISSQTAGADASRGFSFFSLLYNLINQFILVPIYLIYVYLIYNQLKSFKSPLALEEESKIAKRLKIFWGIAVLGLILTAIFAGFVFTKIFKYLSSGYLKQPQIESSY